MKQEFFFLKYFLSLCSGYITFVFGILDGRQGMSPPLLSFAAVCLVAFYSAVYRIYTLYQK